MRFVPAMTILSAVAEKIRGIRLEDETTPAFHSVKIYTQEDLLAGLRELYEYDDRICLVVPLGNAFVTEQSGGSVVTRQALEFVALLTDRNYGGEATAMTGSAENPGSLKLGELVRDALLHSAVGIKGLCIYPERGQPFRISESEKEDAPGRECWSIEFRTASGEVRNSIATGVKAV